MVLRDFSEIEHVGWARRDGCCGTDLVLAGGRSDLSPLVQPLHPLFRSQSHSSTRCTCLSPAASVHGASKVLHSAHCRHVSRAHATGSLSSRVRVVRYTSSLYSIVYRMPPRAKIHAPASQMATVLDISSGPSPDVHGEVGKSEVGNEGTAVWHHVTTV